jgi:cyanophycinase-like exopeptidase
VEGGKIATTVKETNVTADKKQEWTSQDAVGGTSADAGILQICIGSLLEEKRCYGNRNKRLHY